MQEKRKIIEIDEEKCIGCGLCIQGCAEGALELVDGKAKIVKDFFCDGLGACLGHCPQGALRIVKREAPPFDKQAAMAHVEKRKKQGCPGQKVSILSPSGVVESNQSTPSQLAHWPVKIRLAPPVAPFFHNAHLLIAGDCCSIASPNFHQHFLQGKVVLAGCPKFDDRQGYVEKLAEIFHSNTISTITVMEMEVPCCSGMHIIVGQALQLAKKNITITRIILSRAGNIIKEAQIEKNKHCALLQPLKKI